MRILLLTLLLSLAPLAISAVWAQSSISEEVIDRTVAQLISDHGHMRSTQIDLGTRQVAQRWWPEDGDAEAYFRFCVENFSSDPVVQTRIFERLEASLEQIDGHLHEVRRTLTTPLDLDTGPVHTIDRMLARSTSRRMSTPISIAPRWPSSRCSTFRSSP